MSRSAGPSLVSSFDKWNAVLTDDLSAWQIPLVDAIIIPALELQSSDYVRDASAVSSSSVQTVDRDSAPLAVNPTVRLPVSVALHNLRYVQLNHCGLSSLGNAFCDIWFLLLLDLSNNEFTSCKELGAALGHMTILDFRVQGNPFEDSLDDRKADDLPARSNELPLAAVVRKSLLQCFPFIWCLDGMYIFPQERGLTPMDEIEDTFELHLAPQHAPFFDEFARSPPLLQTAHLHRLEYLFNVYYPEMQEKRKRWNLTVLPFKNGKPHKLMPQEEAPIYLSDLTELSSAVQMRFAAIILLSIYSSFDAQSLLPLKKQWCEDIVSIYPPFIRIAVALQIEKQAKTFKTIRSVFDGANQTRALEVLAESHGIPGRIPTGTVFPYYDRIAHIYRKVPKTMASQAARQEKSVSSAVSVQSPDVSRQVLYRSKSHASPRRAISASPDFGRPVAADPVPREGAASPRSTGAISSYPSRKHKRPLSASFAMDVLRQRNRDASTHNKKRNN
eukprot:ANDGO_03278.mRNA.1 hypothetical protein